jgi:hypothetical protein
VYRWAIEAGAVEMIHHQHLHCTVATARSKVDWYLLGGTQDDILEVPAGEKPMIRLGAHAHALSFEHHRLEARFREIAAVMSVDYADEFNGHLTLARGPTFRQPSHPYNGPLVLGPEVAEPFLAGISFPRGIPIDRNQFREAIGLALHDDEAAKEAEYRSRVKVPEKKKKIPRERLHER